MKKLLIIGAGQYGSVVQDIANSLKEFSRIEFIDDNSEKAIGKVKNLKDFKGEFTHCIAAVGNPEIRKAFLQQAKGEGFAVEPLISPMAFCSPTATVGEGSVLEPMAVVNANAVLGKGCIVSAGGVVNHNAILGDFSQVDCNATVSARAVVEENKKIPCGEVI